MSRFAARVRSVTKQLTAGFTLVELMVALTGGLFISVAVFMLAKQATGLYQSEARMSNATLGSVVGFERLRLDIERAGFMSSPNAVRDVRLCPYPSGVDASWPAALAHLAAVFIQPTSTTGMPVQQGNHLAPDEIVLTGSYGSAEQFPTRSIQDTGANHVITLETQNGPMARLGYQNLTTAGEQQAMLLSIFGPGRALRIVDTLNREQYGTITGVQAGGSPAIVLSNASPNIRYRGTSGTTCGVMGTGMHHFVNVVNFIKYSIRDMRSDSRYAPLYSAGTTVAGAVPTTDAGRTELVREELNTAGATIDGSAEVIAEFAVDLSFGITIAQTATVSGATTEQLVTLAPGADTVAWAGNAATMDASHGPQRIRGIRARLSVRSREADRLAGMPDGGGVIGPGLFRIGLGSGGTAPFARVRTVQADIALRNNRGVKWL
jgi:hypothetical protein